MIHSALTIALGIVFASAFLAALPWVCMYRGRIWSGTAVGNPRPEKFW
jgi:hypothetical protein